MANQERTFEAGGKSYTIRFTQNALYKLEKQLGLSIMGLKMGPLVLQTMMWAGLEGARLKHPGRYKPGDIPPLIGIFTIEEAGDIIDEMGGLAKATPTILEAWTAALAPGSKNGEGDAAPANPTQG